MSGCAMLEGTRLAWHDWLQDVQDQVLSGKQL